MVGNKWSKQIPLHLMIWPVILFVLIFEYLTYPGIVMAFQDFHPIKGYFDSEFIGLDNFKYIFLMPDFERAFYNTIYIAVLKIVFGQLAAITTALLLNELRSQLLKRSVQTMIYLPHFLSWVILTGIMINILSPSTGIVNQFLGLFGIEPIYFLGDNRWFPFTLVVSDVWKEFGFSTIVYLAAITSVNPALYEAAGLDGANRMRLIWHVTLPGMRPIIVLLATLSLGKVMNAGFEQIFNLYTPVTYESGDIIDTLVYRVGLVDAQYSVATAIGLFKSIISTALMAISYFLAYRLARYRIF
jgi:putative aldouronate transport system permease protein